jgi:hypothetical protein
MPTLPFPASADPPGDDPTFAFIVSALAALRQRDRNEILAFIDFWRDLPREERAIFAKSVKPDLTDEEVARLCGVTPRTLYRWGRYQSFKPRLADFQAARRRRWDGPVDLEA